MFGKHVGFLNVSQRKTKNHCQTAAWSAVKRRRWFWGSGNNVLWNRTRQTKRHLVMRRHSFGEPRPVFWVSVCVYDLPFLLLELLQEISEPQPAFLSLICLKLLNQCATLCLSPYVLVFVYLLQISNVSFPRSARGFCEFSFDHFCFFGSTG